MAQAKTKYGSGYKYWYSKDGNTYVEMCRPHDPTPEDMILSEIVWDHVVLGRSAGFESKFTKPIAKTSELTEMGAEFF